jgi:hypothetical protein
MKSVSILTLYKPKIDDFASARNEILKNSKHDWNLFLDTDEKLEKDITDFDDRFDCFYLNRKNYFLGQYVGSEKIIRLVKKGTGKWTRRIHEVWSSKNVNKVGYLKVNIIHNTANNLKEYIDKMNKYSDIHPVENLKEGKNSNLFKIIFLPLGKFLITFAKSKNFVFSMTQSFHSFLSWIKLYFLQS